MIHNPVEYYEEAQGAANILEFHFIKLVEWSKVSINSEADLQTLSENTSSCMFTSKARTVNQEVTI